MTPAATASTYRVRQTTCACRPAGRTDERESGLQGKTSGAHQMQDQAIAKVESEVDARPWCRRRRIQRAKINKRRHRAANKTTVPIIVQQTSPAVETRLADPFALTEHADTQSTWLEARQQRTPLALTAPHPLALPISRHLLRSRTLVISKAIFLTSRPTGRTPPAYRLRRAS